MVTRSGLSMPGSLKKEKAVLIVNRLKTILSALFSRRACFVCMKSLTVFFVLLIVLAGLFVWRVHSSPYDIIFTKGYLEKALSDPVRGVHAEMDKVFLHWPKLSGPFFVGLENAQIVNAEGEIVLSVEEVVIALSLPRLLIGQIVPRTLIISRPTVKVIRREDMSLDIGFGVLQAEETAELDARQEDILTRIVRYIAHPGEEEGESSPLAFLESFEIQDANIFVEDRHLGLSWSLPNFDISFLSTKTGLSSSLYFDLPGSEGAPAHIRGDANFSWRNKDLALAIDLKNFDTQIFEGKLPELPFLSGQRFVVNGNMEMLLGSGFLFPSSAAQGNRQLNITKMDIKLGDVNLSAQGLLTRSEKTITGPVKIEIRDLPQEQIGPLWPEALKDDNSKVWIVDNITGGIYTQASAEIDVIAQQNEQGEWSVDVKNILADFAFENMSVNYRPPLSPVTESKGKGHFNYAEEKLTVTVEEGKLEDMTLVSGEVELVNIITKGTGVANIHVKLEGPAKTALLFAAKEPINLGDKVPFDMNEVKGNAALDVNISLPTVKGVKMEQVTINIDGTLSDVYVPGVVQGLTLSEGPYKLHVDNELASLEGSGKLEGRPIELTWMEYLDSEGKPHSGKITAKISVDADLRERFGIVLDEFLEGPVNADVTYTEFEGGRSEADIKADITPTRVFAKPFDYEKPPGAKGSATLKAFLKGGEMKEIVDLTAQAPDFKLEKTHLVFRQNGKETQLSNGNISRFVLGETVAALEFEIEDSGRIKIDMKGPFLDLRPFLNEDEEKKKEYDDPPVVLSVAVDAMRTADGETVQYGKIFADINAQGKFNQLELDAIAGKGDIYLRFKPDETGKRTFRLEADDAGAALRAFSVYDKIVGGNLLAYAEPIHGVYDRNLIGQVQIENFKAVKAPVLARLLGALSLPGILNLLNEEGVTFTKMEADFNWLYREEGGLLVLKNGRSSGNSLGLTFDGTFDKSESGVDVSGTIIPLSGLNEIISAIPLVGDILTGGTGGVFAATYTIKGKATEPEVAVNPLSVLAPGILRRILFE